MAIINLKYQTTWTNQVNHQSQTEGYLILLCPFIEGNQNRPHIWIKSKHHHPWLHHQNQPTKGLQARVRPVPPVVTCSLKQQTMNTKLIHSLVTRHEMWTKQCIQAARMNTIYYFMYNNLSICIPWRRPPPTAETLYTIKSHPNYNR